jgi:uncharacterized protein YegP (UPF0339 family)
MHCNQGNLAVRVRFEYKDSRGEYRGKNILVERDYMTTLEQAQTTVEAIRKNNPNLEVRGNLSFTL